MKKLFLTLASLGLMHAAQAEIVEGNVTLQYKIIRQTALDETVTTTTFKQSVGSYKNADFIKKMGDIRGTDFSKSAKLIFVNNGGSEIKYFIREKGKTDFEVTNRLFINQTSGGGLVSLTKGKVIVNPLPILGTVTYTGKSSFLISIAAPNSQDMLLEGMGYITLRYIRSKENPAVSFPLINYDLKGSGQFIIGAPDPGEGLILGTAKLTGAKMLPTPAVPPGN